VDGTNVSQNGDCNRVRGERAQRPFDESPSAFTARDGAELRVLDHKDDWLQVTDGTRRVGWVKRDAALVSPSS